MSRLAVFVERHHAFGRRLKEELNVLRSELENRIQNIEQDQLQLIKLYFMDNGENDSELVYTLKKKYAKMKGLSSPKQPNEKENARNVPGTVTSSVTDRQENVAEADDKQTMENEGDSMDHLAVPKPVLVKPLVSQTVASSAPSTFKRHKATLGKSLTKPNIYRQSGIGSYGYTNSNSRNLGDKEKKTLLRRVSSFSSSSSKSHLSDRKEFVGNNLTAFAFSKYRDHYREPLFQVKRPHEPSAESLDKDIDESLKNRIRTKVVKNYLLTDVFKRLNNTRTSVSRYEGPTKEEKQATFPSMMHELKKCRYLRVPKTIFHRMEETSDQDITKIDIR